MIAGLFRGSLGIDTVWYQAAANLNEYFAANAALLGPNADYLLELGGHLENFNEENFGVVKAGNYGTGQELDQRLVRFEQHEVTRFNRTYFSSRGISDMQAISMLGSFNILGITAGNITSRINGGPWNSALYAGAARSIRINGSANFWFESNRVQIGYGIMDHLRASRN